MAPDQDSVDLEPIAEDLLGEATTQMSPRSQVDLAQALIGAALENRQFVDGAEADLILGLDYCQQLLRDFSSPGDGVAHES